MLGISCIHVTLEDPRGDSLTAGATCHDSQSAFRFQNNDIRSSLLEVSIYFSFEAVSVFRVTVR